MTLSPDCAPVLSLTLSPRYATDDTIFAGTEGTGLFHSDDRGRTWNRLHMNTANDPVNSIVLSPDFPGKPDLLVISGDDLLISRDGGRCLTSWTTHLSQDQQVAAVAAPEGLDAGAILIVGLVDGGVIRI